MRQLFRIIHNYFFYCGIEKEEYNAVKKNVYFSNFVTWRSLHIFMAVVFGLLFFASILIDFISFNRALYFGAFFYSIFAISFFYFFEKDSIWPQILIYVSISLLFIFSCLLTKNNPTAPGTTFIVLLLITPIFMIDKPFWMTIELVMAALIYLTWMHGIKPHNIWATDLVNVSIFTIVGTFLNIIANSIRIREFILTREINIQKDTDDMTGLKNKGALTREINSFLADKTCSKGFMFMMDIDRFKAINDTWGHDVGDCVIIQLGNYLHSKVKSDEILGRFGGDEFILVVKSTDDERAAVKLADEIVRGASENINIGKTDEKISLSIGIAIYRGQEKNYSELFKKADIALYEAKADPDNRFYIYE